MMLASHTEWAQPDSEAVTKFVVWFKAVVASNLLSNEVLVRPQLREQTTEKVEHRPLTTVSLGPVHSSTYAGTKASKQTYKAVRSKKVVPGKLERR